MSKKSIVTILAGVVVVLPFVGLPASVSTVIFVCAGLGIIYIARVGGKKKITS